MVTRVTIYDTGIDMVFAPGQNVWKFMALLGTEHLQAAIMFAPSRTNHLRASHYPVPIMTPRGRRGWRYTIRNDAEYSEYVHRGTYGPIRPRFKRNLKFPVRGGIGMIYAPSVAGQTANQWIDRAWDYVNPF